MSCRAKAVYEYEGLYHGRESRVEAFSTARTLSEKADSSFSG